MSKCFRPRLLFFVIHLIYILLYFPVMNDIFSVQGKNCASRALTQQLHVGYIYLAERNVGNNVMSFQEVVCVCVCVHIQPLSGFKEGRGRARVLDYCGKIIHLKRWLWLQRGVSMDQVTCFCSSLVSSHLLCKSSFLYVILP